VTTEFEQQRFREVTNAMHELAWSARADGSISYANEAWRDFVAGTRGEPRTAAEFVHPEDAAALAAAQATSAAGGQRVEVACRLRHGASGGYSRFQLRVVPVKDSSGVDSEWLQVGTSVEEEYRLSESVHALLVVANSVPVHLLLLDTEERILFANQAAAGLWGFAPGDMIGKTIAEVLGADAHRALLPFTERVLAGERVVYESPFQPGEGPTRYFLNTYVPDFAPDGTVRGFVATGTDITERKRAEEALRVSREHEERARRVLERERERREEFISMLTHDVRTPLTAARLGAQLASAQAGDPVAVRRFAARVEASVERVDSMMRDLLDASRVRAGQKLAVARGACDLGTLAHDVLRELGTIHGERFVLRAQDAVSSSWDCNGLRRVLENLCLNAVKYGAPHEPITVSVWRDETSAHLSVHNRGAAIPANELPTLFDRFRRAPAAQQSRHGGWGLGLTLVKGIAEAHGGSVSVVSTEGIGTTFSMAIPFAVPEGE
jgi:PAS domain S-box-containing protein